MRTGRTGRSWQEGMALLLVLWTIAILALISAVVATTTRTETNRTRNLLENAKAEGLADAGIYRAIAALLQTDPSARPLVDGTTYRWRFEETDVLISIQSEAGKVDLNTASDQLLSGLFLSVGVEHDVARRLVDAVRDFADRDDLRRLLGAEDTDYGAAGVADGAKDGPFDNVAELQQVLGMTPELYESVATTLTVHSGARSIDRSIAPPAALLALPGATPAQVKEIVAARGKVRMSEVRSSRGSLQRSDTQGEALQAVEMFSSDGQGAVNQGAPPRRQSVFAITAIAQTPGGGVFERAAIVRLMKDPSRPFVFHEWRQAWTSSDVETDETEETGADRSK